jgi:hypothetical protein
LTRLCREKGEMPRKKTRTLEDHRAYHREYQKKRRDEDPVFREEQLRRARDYKARNKEKMRASRAEYYAKNKHIEKEVNAKWLEQNKDLYKQLKSANDKRYKEKNKDKFYEKVRDPEFKKRKNEKARLRYHSDPEFRLQKILRANLRQAFRLQRFPKNQSLNNLVGCSYKELVVHLERQFTDGMSWDADIHIDHIRPCASFDFRDPDQVKACFHFSNLQPLWAKDNLRKSAGSWIKYQEQETSQSREKT